MIVPNVQQILGRHAQALLTAPASGSMAALKAAAATIAAEVAVQSANSWPVREAAIRVARLALAANAGDAELLVALTTAGSFTPEVCKEILFASQQRQITAVVSVAPDIRAVFALAAEEVQQDWQLFTNARLAWYSGFGLTVTPDQEQLLAGLPVLVATLTAQATQSNFGNSLPDLIQGLLTYA